RNAISLGGAKCVSVRDEPDYWRYPFEWTAQEKHTLLEKLREARNNLVHAPASRVRGLFDEEDESGESRALLLQRIEDTRIFLESEFSYGQFVEWMVREQAGTIVALDGFVPVLSGPGDDRPSLDMILNRALYRPQVRRDWTPDIGLTSVFAG